MYRKRNSKQPKNGTKKINLKNSVLGRKKKRQNRNSKQWNETKKISLKIEDLEEKGKGKIEIASSRSMERKRLGRKVKDLEESGKGKRNSMQQKNGMKKIS